MSSFFRIPTEHRLYFLDQFSSMFFVKFHRIISFSLGYFIVLLSIIFDHLKFVISFQTDMAWRSSGATHRELIENLYKNGLIKDQRIKNAMMEVDRADFTDRRDAAYEDRPQSSKINRQ